MTFLQQTSMNEKYVAPILNTFKGLSMGHSGESLFELQPFLLDIQRVKEFIFEVNHRLRVITPHMIIPILSQFRSITVKIGV